MFTLSTFFTFAFLLILGLAKADSNWDYIVLSQSWPTTNCIEWKDGGPTHYCSMPKLMSHWIAHGLWPTKFGSEGPNYCMQVQFNETALMPIQDRLEEYWTNIQMPSEHYSFWKHEWLKHGSCAASLPALDSEFKYFSLGLEFVVNYDVAGTLSSHGIFPGYELYSSEQIYTAMESFWKQSPSVHCVHEKGTGKIFLSEIRICLDKTFIPIDCEDKIVECGHNQQEKVIHYPAIVPTVRDYSSTLPSSHWLYKVLYVLRLLVWFSF